MRLKVDALEGAAAWPDATSAPSSSSPPSSRWPDSTEKAPTASLPDCSAAAARATARGKGTLCWSGLPTSLRPASQGHSRAGPPVVRCSIRAAGVPAARYFRYPDKEVS